MNTTLENKNQISEPDILTANTYFWSSSRNASGRRYNESRRLSEVADFFKSLKMTVSENGDSITGKIDDIKVVFNYRESCNNVYKHLSVYRAGNRSNITTLRKLYK